MRRALLVGASGDVGTELAMRMAHEGIEIIFHGGRDRERFDRAVARLQGEIGSVTGNGARSRVVPVWEPIVSSDVFLKKIDPYLPADIIVVIFGPVLYKTIAQTEIADWRTMGEHNYVVPSALLAKCADWYQRCEYGRMVVFGADYSTELRGYKEMAAYGAAKWALASVVQSAAQQITNPNFGIYMIAPGYITPNSPSGENAKASPGAGREIRNGGYHHNVGGIVNQLQQLLGDENSHASGSILAPGT